MSGIFRKFNWQPYIYAATKRRFPRPVPAGAIDLTGNGIASAEAFGNTLVSVTRIYPAAIPSGEAFGTAVIAKVIAPTGIATVEAFGSPTVVLGDPLPAPTLLTSGGSTTDQASFLTASITPPANRLILLFIDASFTNAQPATPTVTGNGLTWELVNSVHYKTGGATANLRLFLFRAMGASPSTGQITIAFGSTHTGARWDVIAVANTDTSGSNGSGAIVQSAVNSGTTALGEALDVTLASGSGTRNRAFAGFGTNSSAANSILPRANWTEISDDAHGTPSQTLESQWRSDQFETTASGIQNSTTVTMGGIAIEVKAVPVGAATISPSGIPSAESFGTARTIRTVFPSAITSAEAFGSPTVSPGVITVSPSAIGSAETFGTALIVRIIAPTGIASAEAFGTAKTIRNIVLSGIASGEAFGSANVGVIGTPIATNTLEGISAGTGVTTGNSGGISGTAFDAIGTSATCTVTASSTHPAHGVRSMRITLGTTAGEAYAMWSTVLGAAVSTRYERLYPYFESNPGSVVRILRWMSSTTQRGAIAVNTAGKIILQDAAGTQQAISSNSIPLNEKFRLEARFFGDAVTGQIQVKIWTGVDADTNNSPLEIITTGNINTGGTTDRTRYGHSGAGVANVVYEIDSLAIANDGYVGPMKVITPGGISSQEVFGVPVIARVIFPLGIASAEVFGSPTVLPGFVIITPSSIGSAEAFGSAKIVRVISPTSIASAEVFGTSTVSNIVPGVPTVILSSTNLSGVLSDIQDDPLSPDSNWLTAVDPKVETDLRVGFDTPSVAPGSGGPTRLQFRLRRTVNSNASNPVALFELWENGSFKRLLGSEIISSTTGQLVEIDFDPADLTTSSGVDVECRVRVLENDSLLRKDLMYGSEIGAWREDGNPAVDTSTNIPQKVIEAAIPVVRYAVHDTFTDLLDPAGNPGQVLRADFRNAISGIVTNLRAVPWIKMLPITKDVIESKAGDVWCPPWTGSAAGNLPTYRAVLDEIREVYNGPIIIESNNEMEYACWQKWNTQGASLSSAGSVGVSQRIGQHYAQTMGELRRYARTLGFHQILIGGYLGISGGPQWGQNPSVDGSKPYGYAFTFQDRWVDEFNNAVKAAYDSASQHEKADLIPDFESIHAYPHGGDFSTSATGYEFTDLTGYDSDRPDDIAYSYYRQWLTNTRSRLVSIWGSTIGNQILLSISEWNAGLSNSSATWSGWTTGGRPEAFYSGWLNMLKGDGSTTGSGTRYWNSNVFLIASQSDTGSSQYYNLIRMAGTTPPWYNTFKLVSTGDSGR